MNVSVDNSTGKFRLFLAVIFIFWNIDISCKEFQNYINDIKEELVKIYAYENVNSDAKIERQAVLVKKKDAKATILICHGYTVNKYDISFLHMVFPDYNTLAFDFRAHGEQREDQVCTFGRNESYDVLAAYEFIKSDPELRNKPIIGYGFSMGAVSLIIAQAVHRNLFDALILDCPFDSTDKLIDRAFKQLKIKLFGYHMPLPGSKLLKDYAYVPYVQNLLKNLLDNFTTLDAKKIETLIPPVYPEEAMKYISIPCYFISCINDDKVPEDAILSIYNNARGFKRLWLTNGRRHFDTVFFKLHKYCYKVNNFIDKHLNGKLNKKVSNKIIRDFNQKDFIGRE